jgi:hypothetical protein
MLVGLNIFRFHTYIDVRYKKAGAVNSGELLDILSDRKSELAGYDQQDAHELFQVMMSILTEEAKQLSPLNVLSLRPSTLNGLKKSHGVAENSFKCPLQGTLGSQLICQVCSTPRPIRHQQYLDLSLPIPVVPTTPGTPDSAPRALLIHDCINEFLRGEQLEDVECPACTVNSTTSKIKEKVEVMERVTSLRAPNPVAKPSSASTEQAEKANGNHSNGNSASNGSHVKDMLQEELRTSSYMLKQLNSCCMLGENDSLVMDIDVDDWSNLSTNSKNLGQSSPSTERSGSSERALAVPSAPRQNEGNGLPTTVDQHLIERIRTSVRKSMYLMNLPEMLCLQINRLVYNPITDRKMKLPQHVKFGTKLDMSMFQLTPEQRSRASSISLSSTMSSPAPLRLPQALPDTVDDIDVDIDIEDVEPLSTVSSTAVNIDSSKAGCANGTSNHTNGARMISSVSDGDMSTSMGSVMMSSTMTVRGLEEKKKRAVYDLCAVIIHSGSADGGKCIT